MTKQAIEVDGARELRKRLKAIEGGIADLKSAHAAAANIVEKRAVQIVPRRSGTLSGSLRSSGQASGAVVRAGRVSVPYAGPIHFGWPLRNIKPQPFLYNALDDRRSQVTDAYESAVDKIIKSNGF